MTVYLLHFERRISPRHTCQHYIGWTPDLEHRLDQHDHGNGARLTAVAAERGIGFELARTWQPHPGPCVMTRNGNGWAHCKRCRDLERRLKAQHNGPRLCPICNPRSVN